MLHAREAQGPTAAGRDRTHDARRLAEELLEAVGTRLAHTRTVAAHASGAASILDEPWRWALEPAAWLHDVGYSPRLARVGFHPFDGARYLRAEGWPSEVCRLVAWHTAAPAEAALRKLDRSMVAEFIPPPTWPAAVMSWCDLCSSPAGEPVTPADRIDEILSRYEADSVVHQAVTASRQSLLVAARSVADRASSYSR